MAIMNSFAILPKSQELVIRQSKTVSGPLASAATCALRRRSYITEQRRTIVWRGCRNNYDRRWWPVDRACRKLYNRTPSTNSPHVEWHLWQDRGLWRWPRFRQSRLSAHMGTKNKPLYWEPAWERKYAIEKQRFEREYEEFEREMRKDPIGMLFGTRLQQSHPYSREGPFSSIYRYVFGLGDSSLAKPYKQGCGGKEGNKPMGKASDIDDSKISDNKKTGVYQFDPITGRMISSSDSTDTTRDTIAGNTTQPPVPDRDFTDRSQRSDFNASSGKSVNAADFTDSRTNGQQRNDGVWLMAAPEKDETSGSALSSTNHNDKSIQSSEKHSHENDTKQPTSHLRSIQSLFTKFKDHFNAKSEIPGPDPSLEGLNVNEFSAENGRLPASDKATFSDPERMNIESLRATDVRSSFEHRKSELESQNWNQKSDDSAALQTFEIPGTARKLAEDADQDSGLREEIQKIYEDTYGEITPTHTQAHEAAVLQSPEPPSNGDGELERRVCTINAQKISPDLVLRLATAINGMERTNNAINDILKSTAIPQQNLPMEYRILAYDSSTMQVQDAKMASTSSFPFTPLHPVEAISRLNNPSKFLEFFPSLVAQGYEVFSASGDVLVFKKAQGQTYGAATNTSSAKNASSNLPEQFCDFRTTSVGSTENTKINPEAQTQPSSDFGRSATSSEPQPSQPTRPADESLVENIMNSLTGSTMNKQASICYKKPSQLEQEPSNPKKDIPTTQPTSLPQSPTIIRRQETHYTGGPPNWLPYDPKAQMSPKPPSAPPTPSNRAEAGEKQGLFYTIRKALRRAVLTGLVAGGTCYAIGVVAEYFRTGGQDGLGPKGFTGFETR